VFDRAQSVAARNTERSGAVPVPPIELKGNGTVLRQRAVLSASEEQAVRAAGLDRFTLGSRLAHCEARLNQIDPQKWLSVAPLVEPELSPAGLWTQQKTLESVPLVLVNQTNRRYSIDYLDRRSVNYRDHSHCSQCVSRGASAARRLQEWMRWSIVPTDEIVGVWISFQWYLTYGYWRGRPGIRPPGISSWSFSRPGEVRRRTAP
jgi:hypothetical protein